MKKYIDGFVFPVHRNYIDNYKKVALEVADIWKEYGAIDYFEFIGDDLFLDGTKSFTSAVEAKKDEEIIFGWVVFPSKEVRELANKKVPNDPRMTELVAPLFQSKKIIFDASRMIYGGFRSLI